MATIENFVKAKEKLSKVLLETNLIYSPIFSDESGNEIYIKLENCKKQVHLK